MYHDEEPEIKDHDHGIQDRPHEELDRDPVWHEERPEDLVRQREHHAHGVNEHTLPPDFPLIF